MVITGVCDRAPLSHRIRLCTFLLLGFTAFIKGSEEHEDPNDWFHVKMAYQNVSRENECSGAFASIIGEPCDYREMSTNMCMHTLAFISSHAQARPSCTTRR